MRRREFIALSVGAAAWPLALRAQQAERVRRVGLLILYRVDEPLGEVRFLTFVQALEKLGWIVGRNLQIDARWTANDAELIRRHVTELVAAAPDVILALPPCGEPLMAIRVEGGLFPAEFLQAVVPERVPGESASDYGDAPSRNLRDEIGRY